MTITKLKDGDAVTLQVDGRVDTLVRTLTEIGGDDDIRADGNAEKQIEEHIDDSRRAADGRLILAGGELAENGNIHGVEQLLQDAAERQRQGKQHELAQKPAVQHVDLIAFDG